MKDAPNFRAERDAVSPPIAIAVMVAVVVALFALLYITAVGYLRPQAGGLRGLDPVVDVTDGNWTITFAGAPSGRHAESTFVLVRTPDLEIVLPRTPLAALTETRWPTTRALYRDGSPATPEITALDALVLDRTAYPADFIVEFSDAYMTLATATL